MRKKTTTKTVRTSKDAKERISPFQREVKSYKSGEDNTLPIHKSDLDLCRELAEAVLTNAGIPCDVTATTIAREKFPLCKEDYAAEVLFRVIALEGGADPVYNAFRLGTSFERLRFVMAEYEAPLAEGLERQQGGNKSNHSEEDYQKAWDLFCEYQKQPRVNKTRAHEKVYKETGISKGALNKWATANNKRE